MIRVWFNALIALLFIVLALAMFDVIEIDFSRFQAAIGIRGNERGSFPVALAMGAVSALLAVEYGLIHPVRSHLERWRGAARQWGVKR